MSVGSLGALAWTQALTVGEFYFSIILGPSNSARIGSADKFWIFFFLDNCFITPKQCNLAVMSCHCIRLPSQSDRQAVFKILYKPSRETLHCK